MINDYNDHVFALSGGERGSGAQVFRDAERAAHALVRHYRLHATDQGWSIAFVWLKDGETAPVSITDPVRAVFAEGGGEGRRLQRGSNEFTEWDREMTSKLMELFSELDHK